MTFVAQPPYSPDLVAADFFLFPNLKSTLKGHRFNTYDEIQKHSKKELFAIPKEAFQKVFRRWQKLASAVLLAKETTLKATNLNKLYLSA
jgi:hypothetical protein